jgi:hypothetical protein
VTPAPTTALVFSEDGITATLQMANVPIIDQPRWPAIDAETNPAFLDFKLVFTAAGEPVKYENAMQQYRFEGFKAKAQLEATVRVPSIDFTFKTDPLETSSCDFAVMGSEANGKYYEA